MVTTTGRISPSCELVWALKPLQNSMMLTPCCPRAGPTGGEGLALPAGICSFTIAWTFFTDGTPLPARSQPFHLVVLELDRGRTPEDRHHHLHTTALGVDVFDRALEIHERSVDDAHLVAALEDGLRLRLLGARLHLPHDLVHLVGGERHRSRPRTHEAGDLGSGPYEVPRLVAQLHLHQHVAGKELLLRLPLLLVPDLDHLLGRHQDARDLVAHAEDLGPRRDPLRHLVLEAGIGVYDEPLPLARRRLTAHRRILSTTRARTMSTPPRNSATTTVTTMTTTVEFKSS